MIKFTKVIENLPSSVPFVGPETQERVNNKIFLSRLGANENVFGPSPRVVASISDNIKEIWKYGDPENYELKEAIARHENVQTENIVVGEGIDGLLGYLCRLIVDPGINVVTSRGAYPTFNYHVSGFGGTLHFVPYRDDYEDIESLLIETEKTQAKILYLANPDNPMGTYHSKETIEDLISNLPENMILCLDEAYSEFVPKAELPKIDPNNIQVIRMRTFSKGYGLAGARVGYAIGEAGLIKSFDKIRNHFGVSRVAQKAGIVALADQDHLNRTIELVNGSKNKIMEIALRHGLESIPSFANFVAVDCGQDENFAKVVLTNLIEYGIFVRMPFFAPQNRCIRISAGTKRDLNVLNEILPLALDRASSTHNS